MRPFKMLLVPKSESLTLAVKRLSAAGLVAFSAVGLVGCENEEVDDQGGVAGISSAVNPAPELGNYREQNARHRILMAVVDSGTDYNHPYIRESVHFTLNSAGVPIGAGFDLIAEDRWPAPYILRTVDRNPEAGRDDREKGALASARTRELLRIAPDLRAKFSEDRSIEQESGNDHGSHVGALMVYDEPALGLLPFRVLPVNVVFRGGHRDYGAPSKHEVIAANIMRAMTLAVAGGARVINVSLSLRGHKDGGGGAMGQLRSMDLTKLRERIRVFNEFARANPQVAFVAASGNNSTWVDGRANLQLPCGVDAPNVLCVGALDDANSVASFSNIVISGAPFILAPGIDVISAYPTRMCDSTRLRSLREEGSGFLFGESEATWFRALADECRRTPLTKPQSGTSMASPIVARQVGKIFLQDPSLTGAQAIQRLLSSGETFRVGVLELKRLRIQKPSWYPSSAPAPGFSPVSSRAGYFEFYSPSQEGI